MEWEKISANHTSEERLISKIYQELIQLNSKKTKNKTKQNKKTMLLTNEHKTFTDIFPKKTYINGQQVHENMLNIPHHLGNANENYSEIST